MIGRQPDGAASNARIPYKIYHRRAMQTLGDADAAVSL
jgi:hypothetical protein